MVPERLAMFVEPMAAMARRQFPLSCPACRRRYRDFRSFVEETLPAGTTLGYPLDSLGMISWVRCACGGSLTLRCEDVGADLHRRFTATLEEEARASGLSKEELMAELRDEIRRRELAGV